MDCGATVHGYQSDISRSFVYGKATPRQRQVWGQMRKGQDVAFAAAKLGTPARSEEHTSELQSLMRHSYAVLCLKKTNKERTKMRQYYAARVYNKKTAYD